MTAYFSSRRGEITDLDAELNSFKAEVKREAIKKVIAAMTIGKDVSVLFPHVVKCLETPSIELKKLVYLYIINYAKTQPELAFMAVNSFRKDARHHSNPLLRALAVRTMGYIRVERISEYIFEPLAGALQDEDPYVRKTAAICVAKLYDIVPQLIEDEDILSRLCDLLHDGNAMVVANAVAAIAEIGDFRKSPLIDLTAALIGKLLAALNECTDWGQIFILDHLSNYTPADSREAEAIIERVVPRLAHNNPALVLTAVKVVIRYMDYVTNPDAIRILCRKVAPSLVSLLSSQPEIQYVALRNISLIVQKRPNILEKDVRVFFCKYNDPNYVKVEKLDIIFRLADLRNIDVILHELKDYATEVDVEFVRKAVQTIGRCAIKLERAADRCVLVLQELILLKIAPILQEVLVVVKDIFRTYPTRFGMLIKDIFNNMDELEDPESRAAFVWILGEYAERIEDADVQIGRYVDSFKDEQDVTQFQVLTATVKLFLKKPQETEELIAAVLRDATEEGVNPDLKDRALVYWRMLSTDPQATQQVVLCQRPPVNQDKTALDPEMIDKLIEQLATVASVYHVPAKDGLSDLRAKVFEPDEVEDHDYTEIGTEATNGPVTSGLDLLELQQPKGASARIPLQVVLTPDTESTSQSSGLQIEMAFQRTEGRLELETKFSNCSADTVDGWALQFNVNPFGLQMAEPLDLSYLRPDDCDTATLRLKSGVNPTMDAPGIPFYVQMAVKSSLGVFYFQTPCMLTALLTEEGKLDRDQFRSTWQSIDDANDFSHSIPQIHSEYKTLGALKARMEANNIFLIAQRSVQETSEEVMYWSSRVVSGVPILAELRVPRLIEQLTISVRTDGKALTPLFVQAVNFLLVTAL